jgi:hypothetical protein
MSSKNDPPFDYCIRFFIFPSVDYDEYDYSEYGVSHYILRSTVDGVQSTRTTVVEERHRLHTERIGVLKVLRSEE